MICIHSKVCKYKHSDSCELADICKFSDIETPSITSTRKWKGKKRGKYHKRGRPGGKQYVLTISKKDIKAARKLLKERKSRGFLSNNQILALDQFKNVSYEELEDIQKKQILDIVKDTNKPKTILAAVKED